MSENPFVGRLGDAIEAAAERHIAGRRRRRRRLTAGVIGAVVLGTSVAAATTIFSSSERLAAGSVLCYESADMSAGPTREVGMAYRGLPPADACAAELGTSGPRVACDDGESVVVVPTAATCRRLGLSPLPASYERAHKRVLALERDVGKLESSVPCIPPEDMARRVQALLDESGWAGWRTQLRLDVSDGPCGYVTGLTGNGSRSIIGSLLPEERRVMVVGEAR